jgi:hypothetical protein
MLRILLVVVVVLALDLLRRAYRLELHPTGKVQQSRRKRQRRRMSGADPDRAGDARHPAQTELRPTTLSIALRSESILLVVVVVLALDLLPACLSVGASSHCHGPAEQTKATKEEDERG